MKDHLSYSQISMFLRCGEQYRRRYIEGEIIPPDIGLVRGKSVHSGIEYNFSQKIDTRIDLPQKHIVDYSVSKFDETIKDKNVQAKKKEKDEGRDSVAALSGLYTKKMAPVIQPKEVEKKMTVNVSGDIPIVMVIDCIDDKDVLRETKTAGKKKQQKDIDNSLQFTLYHIGYKQQYGKMPKDCIMDVLINKKVPEYQVLRTKREPGNLVLAIRIIQSVLHAIQKEVFLPASESSWACDSRFCGYYNSCKFKQAKIF